jgi:hypothetical protein
MKYGGWPPARLESMLFDAERAVLRELATTGVAHSLRTIRSNVKANHGLLVSARRMTQLEELLLVYVASERPRRWRLTSRGRMIAARIESRP